MKKLYHKATVHPSPPLISDHLAFLPATILTLAAALSPEDREVLAYLISCSSASTPPASFPNFSGKQRRKTAADHAPLFGCSCFGCYMSYWVRWDESPNRQLIHEIIDAFEDWLAQSSKGGKNNNGKGKRDKRNKKGGGSNKQHSGELKRSELLVSPAITESSCELKSVGESSGGASSGVAEAGGSGGGERVGDEEKGSVRRFVSFIGERIWGAWGQ